MSWRKGSTASVETSGGSNGSRAGAGGGGAPTKEAYPYALVLRLRVVQIVCGIAAVVMGSVAAIEERQNFNLSLGVPAGTIAVLAAGIYPFTVVAWSIHRSVHRNAGGRRGGAWIARVLWAIACLMHFALLILSFRTIFRRHRHGASTTSDTSLWVAALQAVLAAGVLISSAMVLRLRFVHGPPPSNAPSRSDRCPRSTSHTAVSMVPIASTYGGLCAANDSVSKSGDNASSDNETMEINVNDNKAMLKSPKSKVVDSEKCGNGRNLPAKVENGAGTERDGENGAVNGGVEEKMKDDKKNLI